MLDIGRIVLQSQVYILCFTANVRHADKAKRAFSLYLGKPFYLSLMYFSLHRSKWGKQPQAEGSGPAHTRDESVPGTIPRGIHVWLPMRWRGRPGRVLRKYFL